MHFIEQIVRSKGRRELPNAFRTHVNILSTFNRVNEQFFTQVKEAVEVYERLDGDRSIPWVVEEKTG